VLAGVVADVAVAPEDPEAWETAAPQPTGGPKFAWRPGLSMDDPGFGKRISMPSVVLQLSDPIFRILAVNILGKALYAA